MRQGVGSFFRKAGQRDLFYKSLLAGRRLKKVLEVGDYKLLCNL